MPFCLLLLFSLLLDAPGVALRAWDARATAQLRAQMERIRQAGQPASLEELDARYHQPLKGPNAAPLYQAAFARMNAVKDQAGQLEGNLPLVGNRELPQPGQRLKPGTVAAVRAWLELHRDALVLLHKAARVEDCRFPLDLTKGIALELPHLANMRNAARLLALEAVAAAARGDGRKAVEAGLAGLRLARALRREPILISALVRIACDAITVRSLEWCLGAARAPAQALLPLQEALAAEARENIALDAMIGERCFGLSVWERFTRPGGRDLAALLGGQTREMLVLRLVPATFWKADKVNYLRIMNDYVEALTLPPPRRYAGATKVGEDLDKSIPRWSVLTRMLAPALGASFRQVQRHAARCEAAAVAVAALRFRAEMGRYPDRLTDLVPDFLEAVPRDPFDDKPLRYRKALGGIVVYSVGEDQRDDGGKMKDRRGPDIAFRLLPRTASF